MKCTDVLLIVVFASNVRAGLKWQQYPLETTTVSDYTNSTDEPPPPRAHAAISYVISVQFFAIFGGQGADGNALGDTFVLDAVARRWYRVGPSDGNLSPSPRFGMIFGTYEDTMYIFGGCADADNGPCYNELWAFNVRSFEWRQILNATGAAPSKRAFAAGGIYPGSSLFYVGLGWDADSGYQSDVHMIDVNQLKWVQLMSSSSVYNPDTPHGRAFSSHVLLSEIELLIQGGCVKHSLCSMDDAWVLDTSVQQWTKIAKCRAQCQRGTLVTQRIQLRNQRASTYALQLFGDYSSGNVIGTAQPSEISDTIPVIESQTRQWTIKKINTSDANNVLPRWRRAASTTSTDDGRIFVYGGILANGSYTDDLWALIGDPSNDEEALDESCSSRGVALLTIHAWLAFVGLGVLLQTGAGYAYFSTVKARKAFINEQTVERRPATLTSRTTVDTTLMKMSSNARRIHAICQITGTSLTFIAILFGLFGAQRHATSVHAVLGILICLLLIVQVGILLAARFQSSSTLRRRLKRAHFYNAVAILVLGVVNSILGLLLLMVADYVWILYFIYTFVIVVAYCIAQALNIF